MENPSKNEVYDVIIVGGGLSGLYCARKLKDEGKKVLVLEARDRVGGRTSSIQYEDEWFDVGGQWTGSTQFKVKELAKELGLKLIPQYVKGKNIIVDTTGRIEYDGDTPFYPSYIPKIPSIPVSVDFDLVIKNLEKQSSTINVDEPWDTNNNSNATKWDSMTLDEWEKSHTWTSRVYDAINAVNTVIMAGDAYEISFLYFLFYMKSSGGSFMNLLVTAQEEKIEGGSQQLSNGLVKLIGSDSVKLNAPVRKIIQKRLNYSKADEEHNSDPTSNTNNNNNSNTNNTSNSNITFSDYDYVEVHSDIGVFNGKYVVLAIPPLLCGKIDYNPPLPPLRDTLTMKMPMGSAIKTLSFYSKAWWRSNGYSGQILSSTKKFEHPVLLSFDDCDNSLKYPCIVGFIVGDNAIKWASYTQKERQLAVAKQYYEQFQIKEALEMKDYIDKVWINEEWSKGCYVGLMPPGLLTTCGSALRDNIGRIYFAGTETAKKWCGYMEGALDAGNNTAQQLISKLS